MLLEPLKLIVLSCVKNKSPQLTKFHYKMCDIKTDQFQYFLNLPTLFLQYVKCVKCHI